MLSDAALLRLGFGVTYAGAASSTLLGLAVLLARPRTAHSRALAVFLLINGLTMGYIPYHEGNLAAPSSLVTSVVILIVGAAAFGGALGYIALYYPRRLYILRAPQIPWFAWAPFVALPFQLAATWAGGIPDDPARIDYVNTLRAMSGHLARGPIWFFVLVILGRVLRTGRAEGNIDVMAAGWLLYLGAFTGLSLSRFARGQVGLSGLDDPPYYLLFGLALGVLAVTMVRHRAVARRARAMLLGTLMMALAGMLSVVMLPTNAETAVRLIVLTGGVVVATAVTGYALLKHQLLDIQWTIKVGISRSTVAATVLTAGFVTSELASNLLSEQLGPILGVLTAGLLIFAAAPLHRWGQRVADRAMPNVRPLLERSEDERATMYRRLAEAAWSDGTMSRSEARVLQTAREQLGLTLEQTTAIDASLHVHHV